jgi:hypothetical protein
MRRYFVWMLRILILALVFLPVFVPSLERERLDSKLKPVLILAESEAVTSLQKMAELESRAKRFFGGKRSVEIRTFGGAYSSPIVEFDELGTLVQNAKGIVVVYAHARVWGAAARKFNQNIRKTQAFRNSEIHWWDPAEVSVSEVTPSYLVLNDVYVPALSFLGEESRASVEIVGALSAGAQVRGELVVRAGESILSSLGVDISADSNGRVVQTVEVPLSFVKPGSQVLSVQINAPHAVKPLDVASTTVNVVHSKTTLLHIALGPDFATRSLRSKLKFWPNLDLVSYYILRDIFSENSIPGNELSLIEFPSSKLFGEELPNFHGIIIQNFPFGSYLNPEESKNLVEYVKNGGRLLLQAGPLSFSSSSPVVSQLYPCKNELKFDTDTAHAWVPASQLLQGASEFLEALRGLESGATALGCEPVENALVLARTRDGEHPVLISAPVGKGLVVSVLGSDWLYRFGQVPTLEESTRALRVQGAEASQTLFRWVVEFLQRRQDGGIRPPDLAGPRLFSGDDVTLVRSRGIARVNTPLLLSIDEAQTLRGTLLWLNFLGLEVARWSRPFEESLRAGEAVSRNLRLDCPSGASKVRRAGKWPVWGGRERDITKLSNPLVFEGVTRGGGSLPVDGEMLARKAREFVPLLDVFPFLLALALGLLALEQYLVHVRWRGKISH